MLSTQRKLWIVALLALVASITLLEWRSHWRHVAIAGAPQKTPQVSSTPLAQQAQSFFWREFHAGRYEQIPEMLRLLTAAYLEQPRDPKLPLLLAHTHLWKLTERARTDGRDPRVTEHAILAEKYFSEAQALTPDDARILGWLGPVRMGLGTIDQREKLVRRGYFDMLEGVDRYPEFNYFSMGFSLSRLPASDPKFAEGVEQQWRNMEVCAGQKVDRDGKFDYATVMSQETTTGPKRACWNGTIAPHNFEGFFLNMGDMLVKQDRAAQAQRIYAIARLSKTYGRWPYRDLLERSIVDAPERAQRFKQAQPGAEPVIMFNSDHGCTGCHAG
jgi:hypothetical protein